MPHAAQELVIPGPECAHGYTKRQVLDIFERLADEYLEWIVHQTTARCEGRYSCETGPRGWVTYESDVRRYARRGPRL